MKANQEIRNQMFSNGLKHWEVAEKANISESRFSVWLRTPMNKEREKRVITAINELLNN